MAWEVETYMVLVWFNNYLSAKNFSLKKIHVLNGKEMPDLPCPVITATLRNNETTVSTSTETRRTGCHILLRVERENEMGSRHLSSLNSGSDIFGISQGEAVWL